jgi:hypothetical protein
VEENDRVARAALDAMQAYAIDIDKPARRRILSSAFLVRYRLTAAITTKETVTADAATKAEDARGPRSAMERNRRGRRAERNAVI